MLTYLGARLQRAEKMPQLNEILNQESTAVSKKTTPEQMLDKIKGLNAAFGGNVQ